MFKKWLSMFKWESEAQEQGFGAFIQWFRALPVDTAHGQGSEHFIFCVIAWFIQKDHESNEWWREAVADQVRGLEDQIVLLQERLKALETAADKIPSS